MGSQRRWRQRIRSAAEAALEAEDIEGYEDGDEPFPQFSASDKGRGRPDCIVMGKCGLGYFDKTRGNAGRVKSPKVAFELAKACDARGTPFKHGFVDRRDFNHKKREYNFDK